MRRSLISIAACIATGGSFAAEPAYRDDRSDATALVESLYNAINRREYARAFSYFANPPSASAEAYAAGYADTESVRLLTGTVVSEGAAGTFHYTLPVAIEATTKNGDSKVFAGCYELSQRNPGVAPNSFQPLHIDKGRLSASNASLEEALPAKCGDGPVPDPLDALQARAHRLFLNGPAKTCDMQDGEFESAEYIDRFPFEFRYSYEDADAKPTKSTIFRFLCGRGAYNESFVFILADSDGALSIVSLASPDLDIAYEDDDFEKPVKSMKVAGYTASIDAVNADFDPKTLEITSWAKWRGIGDASSIGTWVFRDGNFVLTKYEVDATYDGEIDPKPVLEFPQSGRSKQ